MYSQQFNIQATLEAKCSAAGVDSTVASQLLSSLDYDRLRNEAKPSLDLTVGAGTITVALGEDYFLDARAAVRQSRPKEFEWAL